MAIVYVYHYQVMGVSYNILIIIPLHCHIGYYSTLSPMIS